MADSRWSRREETTLLYFAYTARIAPDKMSEVAPGAKLLSIVREPVERYRSGLNQWHAENRRRSLKRDEKAGKREARMRGYYGRQTKRLAEAVGRDPFALVIVFLQSTTAIGFMSMNFSDAPPFHDLGNIAAAGIMCAFVYSVTLLPALAAFLYRRHA